MPRDVWECGAGMYCPWSMRACLDWSFAVGISKEQDSSILLTSPCVWIAGTGRPFSLERLRFLRKMKERKHPLESLGNFPAREGWPDHLLIAI